MHMVQLITGLTVISLGVSCSQEPLVSSNERLTLTKTGGFETLFHAMDIFFKTDFDDDLKVEFDDIYQVILRCDDNADGKCSKEELFQDPDMTVVQELDFSVFDRNKDGYIALDDIIEQVSIMSALGNDINLAEFIRFISSYEDNEGEIVDIDAFATGVMNFKNSDVNDDGYLSNWELKGEFRAADKNRNDLLEEGEIGLNYFRPTRGLSIKKVCPESIAKPNGGCNYIDISSLVFEADQDGDGKLVVKEFLKYYLSLL